MDGEGCRETSIQEWNIDQLSPAYPPVGIKPDTNACALTGIWPGQPLGAHENTQSTSHKQPGPFSFLIWKSITLQVYNYIFISSRAESCLLVWLVLTFFLSICSSLDDLTWVGEIRFFFSLVNSQMWKKISIFSKYDPTIVENKDLYLLYKLKSK